MSYAASKLYSRLRSTIAFAVLGLLTFQSISYAAQIETGFYKITESHGRLNPSIIGTQIYLAYETTQAKDKSIVKTLRGVFGHEGLIQTKCQTHDNCKSEWAFSKYSSYRGEAVIRSTSQATSNQLTLTFIYKGKPEFQAFAEKTTQSEILDVGPSYSRLKEVPTQYISHRGASTHYNYHPRSLYPANTENAFEDALLEGFSGFEVDIQMSKDGVLFISHDDDLNVSSNLKSKISESTLGEIQNAQIIRSGLVPESQLASIPAHMPAPISTLKSVLDRFLNDPRVKTIVLDVKPTQNVSSSLQLLLANYDHDALKKILVILKNSNELSSLRCEFTQSGFALEGDTGWEPLETKTKSKYLVKTYQDQIPSDVHDTVSISAGIGLGFAGNFGNKILSAIPTLISTLFRLELDIRNIEWMDTNVNRFKKTVKEADASGLSVIAWTVNTPKKIKILREKTPEIKWVLTDLSYFEIARTLIIERAQAIRKLYQ